MLLVESPVESIRQIQSVLEYVIKNNKSLLIIADVETSVLAALAMNRTQGNIKVNVVDAPTYGVNKQQMLSDLSMLTGATIINEDLGDDMDLIQPDHLGTCLKSITTYEQTILQVEEQNQDVLDVIADIKSKLLQKQQPNDIVRLEKVINVSGKNSYC